MIPQAALTAWRSRSPWRDDRQVEQDLLLSRLAIEIANHPRTADRLVWRGGTCLHKLHLPEPRRYSEDLDYVLVGDPGGVGWLVDAFREAAEASDMTIDNREINRRGVKAWATTPATPGASTIRIKIEVNAADATPRMALERRLHEVDLPRWWSGRAQILTFQGPELVGTKFRALAQRSKGRDLWDLWLARRELALPDSDLADCGHYYLAHESISPANFRARLAAHLDTPDFAGDLDPLIVTHPKPYDVQVVGLELISWTDQHLDPLFNARRSRTSLARDQRAWVKHGWAEGAQRCPVHDRNREGSYARCPQWFLPDSGCPTHRRRLGGR